MQREVEWKPTPDLSLHHLARDREELGNFQGQADIASDFKRPAKERALRVKFAFRHFQPVLVSQVEGHIGLLNTAFNQLAGAIGYLKGIRTGLFASDVPLERFVHV